MKLIIIATVLVFVMMSGIVVAEGDQTYGMMDICTDCNDAEYDTANMPCTHSETSSAEADVTETGEIPVNGIEEDWAFGRRNFIPDNITGVMYDFEEGSNCGAFKNQYPDVATFLSVSSSGGYVGYGADYPSYVRIGGSMCGTTRCYMRIYPYSTSLDWIYVVNERAAFSPVTCCEEADKCWLGNCYPGRNAKIEFKEGTNYVSFLVSTGNRVYVRLYDRERNWLRLDTVYRTIDRVGSEPSNFTRVSIHMPATEFGYMTLSGTSNDWMADDLVIGGGYLPDVPPDVPPDAHVEYADVARLAQELHGIQYLEYGLGHDYLLFEYLDSDQFNDEVEDKYWNPDTKKFEEGQGISNAGLILWAYNKITKELYGSGVIKWSTVVGMEKHDFKVDVDPADTQPGDVCFMDRDFNKKADEVYMVIDETCTGMNLITSCPDLEIGVIYSKKSIVESSPAFMGYKRLPGVIKGGHNPIPKGH